MAVYINIFSVEIRRGHFTRLVANANVNVNASLKSLLGTHYQLGGPWATKIDGVDVVLLIFSF